MTWEVKLRVVHDTSGLYGRGDITNRPCPTVTVGANSMNSNHFRVEYEIVEELPDMPTNDQKNKPPYRVPSMEEIAELPWNGYNVVSTFSGCGGSSLGYKMAGFRVLWASEFIPAAQETYRANHPNTILDGQDIRKVSADAILGAIGMKRGELDLLDGSPPCASFSTAGSRDKGWGKVKAYSDAAQRTDDLFFEYARILRGLQPKTFVAENVSGLVKGRAKGYFKQILSALQDCGYEVKAKLLDAQWLGVPQARQRLIFVGVRNDLANQFNVHPAFPTPLSYRYTVRDALPWIVRVRYGGSVDNWKDAGEVPSGTVVASDATTSPTAYLSAGGWVEPEADISRFAIGKEWERTEIGGNNDKYLNLKRSPIDAPSFTVTAGGGSGGAASVTHPTQKRKFSIAELRRICAFPDDFILTGTYAQQWERLGRAVPPVMMSHIAAAVRDEILAKVRG